VTRCAILASLLLTLASSSIRAEEPPADLRFGEVRYPAEGSVHLDEGTIELYIRVDFSTDKPITWTTNFGFVSLFSPDTQEHVPVMLVTNGFKVAMVGYLKPVQQSYAVSSPKTKPGLVWKAGEDHVIAVTWKGNLRQVFVDGVAGPLTQVEGPITLNLAKTFVRLGGGAALFSVDELRVSSVVRSEEELKQAAAAAPTADTFTLLLDHFDEKPAMVAGDTSAPTREAERATAVEGKYGKALKLWSGAKP
jgi:hypothetical protein